MFPAIQDWSQAMMTSLAGAMAMFFAALPKILAFAVILIVGWFIASLIARGVASLLRAVKFNELAQRSGFAAFVRNIGVHTDAAGFLAYIAKWFIRLIVLVVAFDALGLPAVSDVLRQFLLWLPNLAVALVVLVIGGLLANAAAGLVRGATASAGFRHPELIANVARAAVWVFAIIVAVNQIGIAEELINTLFMGAVALLVLALGLAFGLGGRDVAGELLRRWYAEGRANAGKMQEAAQRASQQAQASTPQSAPMPPEGAPFPQGGGRPAHGYRNQE